MNIIHSDVVVRVAPGTTPDYNRGNSLAQLLTLMEKTELAAEREHYRPHSLQYLLPFNSLELYGPAGSVAEYCFQVLVRHADGSVAASWRNRDGGNWQVTL